tara:strand:+ start:22 stop:864 length:843 start_codon:yes stop_codon:yes gene_type:complete
MSNGVSKEKIVVFDLDETLGNFVELGIFWDALKDYHGYDLPEKHFFEIVDLFSDFLRPNIVTILKYLLEQKRNGKCNRLMIYTNNQGPKSWARMIGRYFDEKLGEQTFDRIIAAFKVRGKVVEMCRTSHGKSVNDLIRCTKIQSNAEICFLDDQYHPLMEHPNVFYINVKPYVYYLPFREMAERYYDKMNDSVNTVNTVNTVNDDKEEFITTIEKFMNRYNYTRTTKDDIEQDVDTIISKTIMFHLKEFFNNGKIVPKTRKHPHLTSRSRNRKGGTRKNN